MGEVEFCGLTASAIYCRCHIIRHFIDLLFFFFQLLLNPQLVTKHRMFSSCEEKYGQLSKNQSGEQFLPNESHYITLIHWFTVCDDDPNYADRCPEKAAAMTKRSLWGNTALSRATFAERRVSMRCSFLVMKTDTMYSIVVLCLRGHFSLRLAKALSSHEWAARKMREISSILASSFQNKS